MTYDGVMKRELRKRLLRSLKSLSPAEAARKSRLACLTLLGLAEFQRADVVMSYMPIAGEVDATEINQAVLRHGKTLLLPRVYRDPPRLAAIACHSLTEPMERGSYQILEPAEGPAWPVERIDLVVVPAVAYDLRGFRLGKGGGFYDRFLSQPRLRAVTCGLAFAEQVLPNVPIQEHDQPIQMLAAEAEVLRFTAG